MLRILFFVFIAFLVWLLVRVLGSERRRGDATPAADPAVDPAVKPPPARAEVILQCAWCGAHVPEAEAVALPDGRLYCSDAHRQAALAAAPDRSRS